MDELLLRFSFMDESLGPAESLRFLMALKAELGAYLPILRAYLEENGKSMSLSGQLALESGINRYEYLLQWVRNTVKRYDKNERT